MHACMHVCMHACGRVGGREGGRKGGRANNTQIIDLRSGLLAPISDGCNLFIQSSH